MGAHVVYVYYILMPYYMKLIEEAWSVKGFLPIEFLRSWTHNFVKIPESLANFMHVEMVAGFCSFLFQTVVFSVL